MTEGEKHGMVPVTNIYQILEKQKYVGNPVRECGQSTIGGAEIAD